MKERHVRSGEGKRETELKKRGAGGRRGDGGFGEERNLRKGKGSRLEGRERKSEGDGGEGENRMREEDRKRGEKERQRKGKEGQGRKWKRKVGKWSELKEREGR